MSVQGVDLAGGRRIARAVSARGGGLPSVEAMALPHGDGARGTPKCVGAESSMAAVALQACVLRWLLTACSDYKVPFSGWRAS